MVNLLTSTEVKDVDRIIGEIVRLGECHFPARIRGYYLVGSYAVGEAVVTSDLDMVIVFKDNLSLPEKQRFSAFKEYCQQLFPLAIDLTACGEIQLIQTGGVKFQTASLLMYGEDIRAAVPLKPVADHIRDSMHAQYPLFARVRGNAPRLIFPLDYPDPMGEFLGYDCRSMRLADGTIQPGIKDLVVNVLSPAEALILYKTNRYLGSGSWKRNCANQYQISINDEWTELVADVYEYGCQQWAYLVPEATGERKRLRRLCEQALGFENHFLLQYKDYVLAQLPKVDSYVQLRYVQRLEQIIYPDAAEALASALKQLNNSTPELQQALAATLQAYRA